MLFLLDNFFFDLNCSFMFKKWIDEIECFILFPDHENYYKSMNLQSV